MLLLVVVVVQVLKKAGMSTRIQGGARVQELEMAVEGLKRVVGKLRSENESLRRSAQSNQKFMETTRKNRELKARMIEAEAALQSSKRKENAYDELHRKMVSTPTCHACVLPI